jgi:rhodanese-related sulfurtransferase
MKISIPALGFLILLCVCCSAKTDFGEVVRYEQLTEWLDDTTTETIMVDIRRDDETAEGMIPGARHIPLADLEERIYELPRSARIVLYCQSGVRVKSALPVFKKMGYEKVYNFISYTHWQGHLEKPKP